MAVVPTGSPPWERGTGHTHYGGNVNKRNHLSQGAVDPETDTTAEQLARLASDLAALSRVAQFANLDITCNDTTPAAPTINSAYLMTAERSTIYEGDSAPSGLPAAARVGDGVFTVTFASSYSDDYAVSGTFEVGSCRATNLSTSGGFVSVTRDSATQITVRAFDASGSADGDAQVSVSVWSGGG